MIFIINNNNDYTDSVNYKDIPLQRFKIKQKTKLVNEFLLTTIYFIKILYSHNYSAVCISTRFPRVAFTTTEPNSFHYTPPCTRVETFLGWMSGVNTTPCHVAALLHPLPL